MLNINGIGGPDAAQTSSPKDLAQAEVPGQESQDSKADFSSLMKILAKERSAQDQKNAAKLQTKGGKAKSGDADDVTAALGHSSKTVKDRESELDQQIAALNAVIANQQPNVQSKSVSPKSETSIKAQGQREVAPKYQVSDRLAEVEKGVQQEEVVSKQKQMSAKPQLDATAFPNDPRLRDRNPIEKQPVQVENNTSRRQNVQKSIQPIIQTGNQQMSAQQLPVDQAAAEQMFAQMNAQQTLGQRGVQPVTDPRGRVQQPSQQMTAIETKTTDPRLVAPKPEVTTIVAQPIVIQMPLAVPVMSVDASDEFVMVGQEPTMADPRVQMNAQTGPMFSSGMSTADLIRGQQTSAFQQTVSNPNIAESKLWAGIRPWTETQDEALPAAITSEKGSGDLSLFMPQVYVQGQHTAQMSDVSGMGAMYATGKDARPVVNMRNPAEIASQVSLLASRGGGTMKVKILPEHLGEITISVEGRGQNLRVSMDAATREAKDALISRLPELRQALNQQRFDVSSIEVTSRQGSDSGSQWAGNDPRRESHSGSQWDRYFQQRDQQFGERYGDGRKQGGYRAYQEQSFEG